MSDFVHICIIQQDWGMSIFNLPSTKSISLFVLLFTVFYDFCTHGEKICVFFARIKCFGYYVSVFEKFGFCYYK